MMQGQEVVLLNDQKVVVEVGSGIREVDAFKNGEMIKVKTRTTTIKINVGDRVLEQTVSCSHRDTFCKAAGRREAWKQLIANAGRMEPLSNRENRRRIVEVINIIPK